MKKSLLDRGKIRRILVGFKYRIMKNKTKYFAIIDMEDGKFKIKMAKKLEIVNQFMSHWKRTNARELARKLNKSNLAN